MSIRQTRTGGNPGSGPDHDADPEELKVERGGKRFKVKLNPSDLRPLGERSAAEALAEERRPAPRSDD